MRKAILSAVGLSAFSLLCIASISSAFSMSADRPTISHCNRHEVDEANNKKLIYIEGTLLKHFFSPLLTCECHAYIQTHENEKLATCQKNCENQKIRYSLHIANNTPNISNKGKVFVALYMTRSEAKKMDKNLEDGAVYSICGSIRYPEKDMASEFVHPVVDGITASLEKH